MNTAVINIKIDPKLKKEAQALAASLGFSLSSLIVAYLKHFVRTKTIYITADDKKMGKYLSLIYKESMEEEKIK
jgi:addiction module RelB/DinJ family antitoxin